jgi:hypothetical protein
MDPIDDDDALLDLVQIVGRCQKLPVGKVLREIDHSDVENLKFRPDATLCHRFGEPPYGVRFIHTRGSCEIHR